MYSPAVGPFSAAICLLVLSSTFWTPCQRHQIHLHRHHQAHQHCRPAQIGNQPWRRKQHCDRQGNLDRFPQKESECRSTRIHRRDPAHQSSCEHGSRNHHRQRTVTRRPADILPSGQTPGDQSHQQTRCSLTCHHDPRGKGRAFLSKLRRLLSRQGLEIRLGCIIFGYRSDYCHPRLRPGYSRGFSKAFDYT